jgi:hypothetical protein
MEVAMTSKQDFPDEEWIRIRRAPLVAGVAISLADPGGPIGTAKATPDEAEAFRRWLLVAAQAAADAGKEGGFMGFGGEQVSAGEQRMLDQVRAALAVA